jgi:ubiquinone/menaquinone biosynthesis C-methylase UbiE
MEKRDICPPEKAKGLNSRLRKIVQNPKKILRNHVKPGMKVLDFGCGPGMFSVEIVELGAEVIAADLQQEMLDILKENISGTTYEKKIKAVKCNKEYINVKEKVDLVFTFYVLHEVPDKEKFFRQAKQILKEKGRLYIAEPAFHVSRNDFEEEIELAEKHGFHTIERPKYWLSRAAVLERK